MGRSWRRRPERGAHLRMKLAAVLALKRAVAAAGVDCQALPNGATVEVGESDFEPDAAVNCGERMDDDAVVLPNPVVVVEVLSPGTSTYNFTRKLAGYLTVPSIQHYLIVHPVKRQVVHYRRTGEAFETTIRGSGPIALDPPGITITVEELYEEAST